MNENNKRLWYRALDRAVPETYTTLSGEQLGKAIDTFAELLVRECANWIESQDEAEHPTAWLLCDELKQHFGIV